MMTKATNGLLGVEWKRWGATPVAPQETTVALSDSLLQKVASGDTTAMQDCIDRYGGLVWSLARRMTYEATEAEDAVQEIFIDLWKSAARFDHTVASETTFIAMIARRRLIDRRRKKQRQPTMASVDASPIEPGKTEENEVDRSDDAGRAVDAMRQLRPEQQRVLELAIFHGRTHEQISESTGMPLGTVKTHARRGLIRIREILSGAPSDADAAKEVSS